MDARRPGGFLRWILASLLVALFVAKPALAASTVTYTGPTGGSWNTAANWTSGVNHFVPVSGDNVVLGTPALGPSSVVLDTSYINPGLNSLTIDATNVGTFTLIQNLPLTQMFAVDETIGLTTFGNVYNQSAGSNVVTGTLALGSFANNSSQGSYVLSGTGTLNATSEIIGESSSLLDGGNVFTQTGGNNSADAVTIGATGGGNNGLGAYTISAGTLTVSSILSVGSSTAPGNTFTQNGAGAAVNVGSLLLIGAGTGATYNFSAGTLTMNNAQLFMGQNHAGTFNHSGGSLILSGVLGNLLVGANSGSAGSLYTLSNTGSISGAAKESIGRDDSATFTQTGGVNSIPAANTLYLGENADGFGTYNLSASTGAGTLSTGYESVGAAGRGTFNQTGGSHTVINTLTIGGGVAGTFNISGGSLTVSTLQLNSNGNFSQTGGTFTFTTFNQNAGTVSHDLLVPATSFFNYFGGTFTGKLTLKGFANFNADFLAAGGLENDSSISIPAGRTIGGPITNNGLITLSGGTVGNTNFWTNNGQVTGYGTLAGDQFANFGLITQGSGNLLFSAVAFASYNYGTITLSPGWQFQMLAGSSLSSFSAFNLNGGMLTGAGSFGNGVGGTLVGPGTISVATFFNNFGTIQPGAGTLNIATAWINQGLVQLTGFTSSLIGPSISNQGTIQGAGSLSPNTLNNTTGTIEAVGGTLVLGGGIVTNSAGGSFAASAGNKILFTQIISLANAGLISLTGGTFDTGPATLNNTGQISGFGILRTGGGGLTNNGSITFTGGLTTINGNITNTNTHTINIKFNPAIFTGNITNNAGATIKTTSTTATFAGTFINNGSFISDPATNIFQTNVTIGVGGSMIGGQGDVFILSGGTLTNHGTFDNGGTLQSADPTTNDGTFNQSGPQSWSPNTTFTNNGGTATFATNTGTNTTAPLSLSITAGTLTTTAPQHLASLTFAGSPNNWAGKLDLTNQSAIITSNTSNIPNQIKQVSNLGAWNGPAGITSSSAQAAAATSTATALAYATGSQFTANSGQTTFNGMSFNPTDTLILYTLVGDANMDTHVTFADFLQLQNHYNQPNTDWQGGDFNYDNATTFADFLILQNNYNKTLQPGNLTPSSSTPIPEPASLLLLALALPLMRFKRPLQLPSN